MNLYDKWLSLTDEELAQLDLAEINLGCAKGLPCAEDLNISTCLHSLNNWTDKVRLGTSNALRNREKFPEYDDLSEAEYRILTMYAVLYRHLGLCVSTQCLEPDKVYDGGDSRTNFIHAALQNGEPATCTIAPVIFAAIGRRLGYPLKLVKTRQHLFCRWSGANGERFNIEATDKGYYRKSDEWYHTWPKPVYQKALQLGVFLKDLTPQQELALFLSLRGTCLLWNLRPLEAIACYSQACRLDPGDYFFHNDLIIASMIAEAEKAVANPYLRVTPDPGRWVIPSHCQDWNSQFHQLACDRLDLIRSQRGIKRSVFAYHSDTNYGESRLYHFNAGR